MAVVGNALMGFMAHSEAEQAFQPWWDVTEDFLVYGLIMLGKKVMYLIGQQRRNTRILKKLNC